jgi:hypothetical protein
MKKLRTMRYVKKSDNVSVIYIAIAIGEKWDREYARL